MQCDMCGKEADKLVRAIVEGVEMNVCSSCSGYGKVLPPKKNVPKPSQDDTKKVFEKVVNKRELMLVLKEDFPKRIKEGREKLGYKQIELAKKISERESVIQNIEGGKLKPSINFARKLEKMLGVKLVDEHIEEHNKRYKATSSGNMTLGDLISFKKR